MESTRAINSVSNDSTTSIVLTALAVSNYFLERSASFLHSINCYVPMNIVEAYIVPTLRSVLNLFCRCHLYLSDLVAVLRFFRLIINSATNERIPAPTIANENINKSFSKPEKDKVTLIAVALSSGK